MKRIFEDEQLKDLQCTCVYPCDTYPHCGGVKVTFPENSSQKVENSAHSYTTATFTRIEVMEITKNFWFHWYNHVGGTNTEQALREWFNKNVPIIKPKVEPSSRHQENGQQEKTYTREEVNAKIDEVYQTINAYVNEYVDSTIDEMHKEIDQLKV